MQILHLNLIILLLNRNGQNYQVGHSGQGDQICKDFLLVIWSGVVWYSLVRCGAVFSGLV